MRMQRALEMFIVEGIHTTIPLHRRILADPEFRPVTSTPSTLSGCWPACNEERVEVTAIS